MGVGSSEAEQQQQKAVANGEQAAVGFRGVEGMNGRMDVEQGKKIERGRDENEDDEALLEGQMYDSDPIIHAMRRRGRELKEMLGM